MASAQSAIANGTAPLDPGAMPIKLPFPHRNSVQSDVPSSAQIFFGGAPLSHAQPNAKAGQQNVQILIPDHTFKAYHCGKPNVKDKILMHGFWRLTSSPSSFERTDCNSGGPATPLVRRITLEALGFIRSHLPYREYPSLHAGRC